MADRRRELGEDERALWQRVTASVKPLHPQSATESAPGQLDSVPEPDPIALAPQPSNTPKSRTKTAPPPRPPRESLDHGVAPGLDRRSLDRLRRGKIAYESVLDLHGRSQDEAREFLRRFLAASQAAGRRCVLVVTGKGLRRALSGEREAGVLKRMVPIWLNDAENRGRVLAFSHAIQPHGGDGALYVLLKRRRPNR